MLRGKSVVYCTDKIAASSFSDVFDDHEHEQAPEAQTTFFVFIFILKKYNIIIYIILYNIKYVGWAGPANWAEHNPQKGGLISAQNHWADLGPTCLFLGVGRIRPRNLGWAKLGLAHLQG